MGVAVLIVDDDEASRLVLAALLEDEGLEVDLAGSFAEAARKIAAEGARYDLVLLDQNLGDGRGADLLGPLRARLPRARAALLSGAGDDDLGGAPAPDAALSKGVAFPELLAAIRKLLG